ncbi:MAG TPA: hypothetical protein VFL27_03795 [Candidatus Dormibacteraeota bacterium]|nr:hypothetical protein [Candidatus Dormibacteraeota bacterium]
MFDNVKVVREIENLEAAVDAAREPAQVYVIEVAATRPSAGAPMTGLSGGMNSAGGVKTT